MVCLNKTREVCTRTKHSVAMFELRGLLRGDSLTSSIPTSVTILQCSLEEAHSRRWVFWEWFYWKGNCKKQHGLTILQVRRHKQRSMCKHTSFCRNFHESVCHHCVCVCSFYTTGAHVLLSTKSMVFRLNWINNRGFMFVIGWNLKKKLGKIFCYAAEKTQKNNCKNWTTTANFKLTYFKVKIPRNPTPCPIWNHSNQSRPSPSSCSRSIHTRWWAGTRVCVCEDIKITRLAREDGRGDPVWRQLFAMRLPLKAGLWSVGSREQKSCVSTTVVFNVSFLRRNVPFLLTEVKADGEHV